MSIMQIMNRISESSENEKTVLVISAVVILALIVDMELSNVADILHKSIVSENGVISFITISMIYLAGQYLLVKFAKAKTVEFRLRRKEMRFINTVVIAVEYCVY
jgi:hypothetical protein